MTKDSDLSQKRKRKRDVVVRSSGRLKGDAPEFGLLPEAKKAKTGGFFGRARSLNDTGNHAALYLSPTSKDIKAFSPLLDKKAMTVTGFGTPSPTKGSHFPRSVLTANGKFVRKLNLESMAVYEEGGDFNPSAPSKVKDAIIKKFEVTLTYDDLKSAKEEIARNNGRRCISQNSVMKGSANVEASESDVKSSPNEKYEWLHLVAHRFIASKGQVVSNLVGGTDFANTAMHEAAEKHIEKMVKANKPVTLEVIATMIEGTKMASRIEYNIKRRGADDISFVFDANMKEKPSVVVGGYAEKLIKRRENNDSMQIG